MDGRRITWEQISPFNWSMLSPMLFMSLFINSLMLVIPIYSLQVFDRVLSSQSIDTLLLLTLIALFLLVMQGLLDYLRSLYAHKKAIRFDAIASSLTFEQVIEGGKDAPSLQNDVREVSTFMASPAYTVMFDLPWVPLFLITLFMLNPLIGAVGIFSIFVIATFALTAHKVKRNNIEKAQFTSLATSRANEEASTSRDTVRSQFMHQGVLLRFTHLTAERLWFKRVLDQSSLTFTTLAKYIRFSLQLLIMGISAGLVINNAMSAGGIIAASILTSRLLQPIEQFLGSLQHWDSSLKACQRVKASMSLSKPNATDFTLDEVKGELHLDNISWNIPNSDDPVPFLKDIRLRIEPGNRLALTGSSGSGKSTLCKLIAGIYPASSGKIKIDGAQLENWSRAQLSQTIGYLPQQIEFLNGSIKQNIAHFHNDIADSDIIAAAKKAGVHQTILRFPKGYDTPIGRNGIPLSGGQAQGIALARALCFNPKILILDEPTSHLDNGAVKHFKGLLEDLGQSDVAVILVTHQETLLNHVDWIVQLHQGQIKAADKASNIMKPHLNSVSNKEVANA